MLLALHFVSFRSPISSHHKDSLHKYSPIKIHFPVVSSGVKKTKKIKKNKYPLFGGFLRAEGSKRKGGYAGFIF